MCSYLLFHLLHNLPPSLKLSSLKPPPFTLLSHDLVNFGIHVSLGWVILLFHDMNGLLVILSWQLGCAKSLWHPQWHTWCLVNRRLCWELSPSPIPCGLRPFPYLSHGIMGLPTWEIRSSRDQGGSCWSSNRLVLGLAYHHLHCIISVKYIHTQTQEGEIDPVAQ